MSINCLLSTEDYRGDHSADILVAFDIMENETVESLCNRILANRGNGDHIQLRLAAKAESGALAQRTNNSESAKCPCGAVATFHRCPDCADHLLQS